MVVRIRIKMVEERPPEASIRVWRRAVKAGNKAAGEHWHKKILPRHFKRNATRRYKYKRRSRRWRERKQRLARFGFAKEGGRTDLVFTGQLRLATQNFAAIRAFPKRVTIKMQAPSYLRQRRGGPDKSDEITRVTAIEEKRISDIIETTATDILDRHRARKTTVRTR